MAKEWLELGGGRNAKRFGSWLSMSDQRMKDLATLTVEMEAWNSPTLSINAFLANPSKRQLLASHPRFRFVHPDIRTRIINSNTLDEIFSEESKKALREALPRQQEFVKRLNGLGGKLLIGTDSVLPAYVPGCTPIDEIQMFVEAGISNYEALKAATVNAATSLGIDHEVGTVEVTKKANLILIDGNPLEDIGALWRLHGVMVSGEWHSKDATPRAIGKDVEHFLTVK